MALEGFVLEPKCDVCGWLVRKCTCQPVSPSDLAKSRDPFSYHRPSEARQVQIAQIRSSYRIMRDVLMATIDDCRLRSVALTELESSAHWAIKALVFTDPEAVELL